RDAAVEVRKPTMFGELIIMIVYTPILTLEGIEGKLFRPMALTVIFALLGSMVLSLTLMPVLASLLLPRQIEEREPLLMRMAHRLYRPVLYFSMHHKTAVIAFAIAVLTVTYGMIAPNLGSEFVPRLSEGSMLLGLVRLPGTDMAESVRGNTAVEKMLLENFPDEIRHVWSRIGTAEVATDPMGTELTDVFMNLKPRSEWKKAKTQDELTTLIEEQVKKIQGIQYEVLQPIEHRINEMISGSRSQLAVKIFGDDFKVLQEKGEQIGAILRQIPGNADVYASAMAAQPVLQIKLKQDELARYGVQAQQVLELIESVGSLHLSEVVQGQLRFPLVIRLPERHRASPEAIG
ncbi:MAG TPA: efflux RND transporter permease subunit, partial [Planctomycetaceae bacterium]|nr:efflux RND transporter permease subunit [Planctomycetaceae bacterium]